MLVRAALSILITLIGLAGCHHVVPPDDGVAQVQCSAIHNDPAALRLPPRRSVVWGRGPELIGHTDSTRLVVSVAARSGEALEAAVSIFTAAKPGDRTRLFVSRGDTASLRAFTTDASGRAVAQLRAGRYAVRTVRVGYVERADTIQLRGGFTDTLFVDMRRAPYCLF